MGDIQQVILAVGWALLLGDLVFHALRSMASGKDKPPVKNSGSVRRPGMAGTAPGSRIPPGQKLGGAYQNIEHKKQSALERLVNAILPSFSDYDDYQVTDGR